MSCLFVSLKREQKESWLLLYPINLCVLFFMCLYFCAIVYVYLNAFLMKPTYRCIIALQVVLSLAFVDVYTL